MRYAGVGWRAVAFLVDLIVFFVLAYAVALATGTADATGFEVRGGSFFLVVALWLVYYIAFEATAGATLGKMVLGLRVVRPDGCPIGWSASIIRNVMRIIDGLFFYLVGAVASWTSPRRQRLGDRLADTVVVRQQELPAPEVCHEQSTSA